MEIIKRFFIFLLVAVGVFSTVIFVSNQVESADDWGVRTTEFSSNDHVAKPIAEGKASNVQAGQKSKTPSL